MLTGVVSVIVLLWLAGCAVPLAPGYRIKRETRSIRFIPGQPAALLILVEYNLVNSGTGPLHFVDVRLPSEESSGLADLRVQVDGHDVAPTALPKDKQEDRPNVVRIPFAKAWARKKKRVLKFEYALRSSADSETDLTIQANGFHLGLRGWAPQLLPPKHWLAPYPARPSRVRYTIRVPSDFAILAGGKRKGRKVLGSEIAYRYELRRNDLGPFVVAGHYVKWPAKSGRSSVEFWTAQPLNGNPAQAVQQIAEIWKTLTTNFGPLDKIPAPRIVESSGVRRDMAGEEGPGAMSFLGGALVNPPAFALGIDSRRFLRIVSEALARNWFDEEVDPSAEAAVGMGEGLPEYAEIVTDEARNGPLARRQRIYEYLRRYDNAVKYGKETPIAATTFESPPAQRRIALAKAPLFYIEIEDACGKVPVRAGLAHMLATLRGQEVDYEVLRSALEESTGRDLSKIFREWLHQKGIPKNFRARYRYGEGAEEMGE